MASALLESKEIQVRVSADVESSTTSQYSAESSFRDLDDAFLQTQTRIWLGEVLHARFDEQTIVCDLLADGEVLFAVSETMGRMLLDPIKDLSPINVVERKSVASGNSTARYMMYSKVDMFLQVCKSVGLAGIDLFTPSDVVEKKNTRKVCMCIRSLSKKARGKNLDVPDFDIVTCTVAMPTNMVGFMRRSWELAQYSSSVSSSLDVKKISRRPGQRKSGAASAGSNDYSSDAGSDIAESHGRNLNFSSDATSQLTGDSPAERKYSPTHFGLESMPEDLGRDEILSENMSPSLCESVGSPCSQHDSSDCQLVDSMTPPSLFLGSRISGKVYRTNETDAHRYHDGAWDFDSVRLDWEDSPFFREESGVTIGMEDSYFSTGKEDFNLTHLEANCSVVYDLTGAGSTFNSENDVRLLKCDSPASVIGRGNNSRDDDVGMVCVNSVSAAGRNSDLHHNFSGLCDPTTDNNMLMHQSNFDGGKPLIDMRIEDNGLSVECTSPTADQLSNPNECRDYYLYDDGLCVSKIYTEVISNDSNCDIPEDDCYFQVNQIQGFEAVQSSCSINSDACTDTCFCTEASVDSNGTDVHRSIQFLHGDNCDPPNQTDKDAHESSVVESVHSEEALDDSRKQTNKDALNSSALDSSVVEPVNAEEDIDGFLSAAHLSITKDMSYQDSKDSADTAAIEGLGDRNCDFANTKDDLMVNQAQGFEVVQSPCNINHDACDNTCSSASSVERSENDVDKSIQFCHGGIDDDSPKLTEKDAPIFSVVESVTGDSDDFLKAAHLSINRDMPCQNFEGSSDADRAAAIEGSQDSHSHGTKDGCNGSSHHDVESCVDICNSGPEVHQGRAAEVNLVYGKNESFTNHSGVLSPVCVEKVGCISGLHLGEPTYLGLESLVGVDGKGFQVCNDSTATEGAKDIDPEAETGNFKDNEVKPQQKKPGKMLLKSVMSGTAIAGVMFFLFQLRSGRKKAGEATSPKVDQQVHWRKKEGKQRVSPSLLHREQEGNVSGGVKVNSLYPPERLRFRF